ncbi:MAG: hypothetical protein DMD26_06005 [Gemmatimonadetes bacterium]|nr:MAG: hypothetical protein DMD26_06005 [Gemmatimonadota bacterium]
MKFRVSALIALLTIGSTASAQVGYPPARSPYLDLTYSQELTAIFGYYVGREDPAGVAPGNGSLAGVHYEWRAGGPAHLTGEIDGTRFALTWGAALRYVPRGSRYQIRADFSNRLTSIRYPDDYFRPPTASVPPILTGKDQSVWRNNPALTIGLSYLFSR